MESLKMSLKIENLYKNFDAISLFSDFSMGFQEGTITCILGPSGCGKTTLLNVIGNLIKPDEGKLTGFDGKAVSYIFQDPRLLPWKTVEENIGFVINKELPLDERQQILNRFIRLVELEDFAGYYPSKLSGGMKQRVSIARAFAFPSNIILMDEPLKGLDIKLKLNLIRTFSHIWMADKRTVIFVTHDVDEALLLGNEILVFSQPPVKINAHQKIEVAVADRSLDSDYFKEIKQRLLYALGS